MLRLNLVLLLVVAVLPFPTRLVAEGLDDVSSERVFVTMYGIVLLGIRLLLYALDAYARREHLYSVGSVDDPDSVRRTVMPVVIAYGIAIVIGLVVPAVAVGLYCAIAVVLVVPSASSDVSSSAVSSWRDRGGRRRVSLPTRPERAETRDTKSPSALGALSCPTADVAAAARFYEQIGMRPVAVSEHFAALEMRGGTHLAIHHDPQQVVLDSVPWDLMVEDIELTHDTWQAEGLLVTDVVKDDRPSPRPCLSCRTGVACSAVGWSIDPSFLM